MSILYYSWFCVLSRSIGNNRLRLLCWLKNVLNTFLNKFFRKFDKVSIHIVIRSLQFIINHYCIMSKNKYDIYQNIFVNWKLNNDVFEKRMVTILKFLFAHWFFSKNNRKNERNYSSRTRTSVSYQNTSSVFFFFSFWTIFFIAELQK